MNKVKDIVKIIEDFAPKSLAYEWDNTGLIVGNPEKEVKKVYLTLDLFKYNIDEAIDKGVDMIISHHPILFRGIKEINIANPEAYVLEKLIKNDIALYAAHTSIDCAKGGINDILAERLGLTNIEIIEKGNIVDCGLGRVGNLTKDITLREMCETVKEKLNTPFVRVCGNLDTTIRRVAVGGGACDDLIPSAIEMGADLMVTADMKYHISADSVDKGICVIDAGHYPTEVFVIDIFENLLRDTQVEIFKSSCKDIFQVI